MVRAGASGRPVPQGALAGDFGVLFHDPPAEGLTLTVVAEQAGPVTFRVMDGLDGCSGYRLRPPGVGVEGSYTTELVLVAKTYTV
jgi:hypothetical protein